MKTSKVVYLCIIAASCATFIASVISTCNMNRWRCHEYAEQMANINGLHNAPIYSEYVADHERICENGR